MTSLGIRAFPSFFPSTVIATALAIANSVAVTGCSSGVEAFPGGQNGPPAAAAGSPFGGGASTGSASAGGSSGIASSGTVTPIGEEDGGPGVPGAQFGPQPNADFSSCGVSSDPSSVGESGVSSASPPLVTTPGAGLPIDAPLFGPTVTASAPPPPISGGTLIGLRSGSIAVASDPDRDAIYVVDTSGAQVLQTIALQTGDEPGRLVEDGVGRVHVALRSGGALVTIDPGSGSIIARRSVCPAPRGVAWDSTTDLVWVACATGELVALPAAGGSIAKQWVVERDLRDVIVHDGAISVTEFRSAQILRLAADGSIARRDSIQPNGLTTPQVAWRAVESSTHGTFVVHQDDSTVSIPTDTMGAYGLGSCGAVSSSCAMIDDATGAEVGTSSLPGAVLPVDFAITPDESSLLAVFAGNGFSSSGLELQVLPIDSFSSPSNSPLCVPGGVSLPPSVGSSFPFEVDAGIVEFDASSAADVSTGVVGPPFTPEQAIAVAFDSAGRVLVQSREPPVLHILDLQAVGNGLTNPLGGTQVILSSASRDDSGHDIFHATAGAPIACASCHPEGGDDGHVWILDGFARRTPSLRGTIAGTAPYHWPGDQPDFPTLTNNVYTGRMGGQQLASDQTAALQSWVQSIPAPPSASWVDAAAASRGKQVFEGAACATCHSGPKLTNNKTVDVGTCGEFQVPPLVGVGWRAPLMHNGCATTFADRFGKCSTAAHGSVAALSTGQISDLTAYLDSL
jgi:Cytochrome c